MKFWTRYSRLVFDASHEATLCAATINLTEHGIYTVFLMLLGGGAFGNEEDWIFSAIERAVSKFSRVDLDVIIVSYRDPKPRVHQLVEALQIS